MKSKKKIIILGTGGTAIDILDTIYDINLTSSDLELECIGFLDDNKENLSKAFLGVKLLGPLKSAKDFKDVYFINGIAVPDVFWTKKSVIAKTGLSPARFMNLIHPSASVSKSANIGPGSIIFQNVTIGNNSKVGNHVMVLSNSIISHNCLVGDYTSITGGVCLSGGTTVGKSCYIGTNSSIKGGISIGDYSLIGMGSVVLSDIEEKSVYVGNPAKFLKKTI